MTHRAVLRAMSGLLLGMFVAILSSTVVSTALPRIVTDLGGTQSSYTWIVIATLLTSTITTPIWGKLADLLDRKLLIQTGLTIFVLGSLFAGLAQSTSWLILCRAIQGIGLGGALALVQVIMADLVSPRERGRYAGYLGAVFGAGTVAGPLLGGFITDALGWRWCFYVGVPFAVAALVVLQRTLTLPRVKREVSIDYVGATLMAGGVSSLLIWVSLAGQQYDWVSWQTGLLVSLGLALLAGAVFAERMAKEPLVPLHLFRDRTVVIAVVTSVAIGIAMFGSTVFLAQYMQVARGMTPTESGLLTIPMVIALFGSSTVIGRVISRTGLYKRWMVLGSILLTVGLALMGTLDEGTSLIVLCCFMALIGAGLGMLMQNLVLVVQNVVSISEIGAGSSLIAFFRSLGGAIGVSVMGALLANHAHSSIRSGLAERGLDISSAGGGKIPNVAELPPPIARIVEHAYGTGVAEIFIVATPLGVVAIIAMLLMKEHPLGTKSGIELAREEAARQAASSVGPRPEPTSAPDPAPAPEPKSVPQAGVR